MKDSIQNLEKEREELATFERSISIRAGEMWELLKLDEKLMVLTEEQRDEIETHRNSILSVLDSFSAHYYPILYARIQGLNNRGEK